MKRLKPGLLIMLYNALGIILLMCCMFLIHTTDSVFLAGLYGVLYWFLLVALLGVMTLVEIPMTVFLNMLVLAFSIFFEPSIDTRVSALFTNESVSGISVKDVNKYPNANIFHFIDGHTDTSYFYHSNYNQSSSDRTGPVYWNEKRLVLPVFADDHTENDSVQLWICSYTSTGVMEEEWKMMDWNSLKSGYTLHSVPEMDRKEIAELVQHAADHYGINNSRNIKILRLSADPEWEYIEGVVIFISVIAGINLLLIIGLSIFVKRD